MRPLRPDDPGTARSLGQRQGRPQRPAFTLVELLVVVSIIALLISILLPSLSKARDQAKLVKCLAHQRGLAQAGMVFTGDHNGLFQLAATEGDSMTGVVAADQSRSIYEYDGNKELLAWPVALARSAGIGYTNNWDWAVRADTFSDAFAKRDLMADDFELATCPADRVRISTPFFPRATGLRGDGDPEDPYIGGPQTAYWGYLSFGINEDIVGNETRSRSGRPHPACWKNGNSGESNRPGWEDAGDRLRGNLDRAYDPSTCLLVVDAGPNTEEEALTGEYTVDHAQGLGYANLITSAQARGPYLRHVVSQWLQRIPTKRHPGGAINVTFADFHAKSIVPAGWRFNNILQDKVPAVYSERVRVSPYRPFVE